MGRRALAALLLLAGVLAVAVPAASAATVRRQAWARTSLLPTFVAQPDRLYVAVTAGTEQARAFVEVDIAGADAAAMAAARLELTEIAADSVVADRAVLVACALAGPLPASGELAADEAPPEDCASQAPVVRGDDGHWTLELGVFARAWAAGGPAGVVLLAGDDNAAATFRVSFDQSTSALSGVARPVPPPAPTTTVTRVPPRRVDVPTATVEPFAPLAAPPAAPQSPVVPAEPPSQRPSAPVQPPSAIGDGSALPAATHPSVVPFLATLVVLAAVVLLATPLRRRVEVPPRLRGDAGWGKVGAPVALGAALLPLLGDEITVYKAGLVLVFLVAAFGLHVIVNWAGELSLAHAGMIGLPAFVAATVGEIHGISPVYLLPLATLVGGALGAIVALPTLRARGIQVALVTLAAAIAIDRFFFTKPWLVGPVGGRGAEVPSIGPFRFETSRSLYPVLLAVVVLAAAVLWALLHSKTARGWFWVRSDAAAAAAFGIRVVRYRILAYAIGGCFAGLAGGLSLMWVQRLTSRSFPITVSFTYLLVVVLSGSGFVGGLAAAAAAIEGGRLFSAGVDTVASYLGPLAFVAIITRYPAGLNGAGRKLMERFRRTLSNGQNTARQPEPITLGLVGGVLSIAAGFVAIGVAWYHTGNTDQTWVQNQELLSGGVGGLALVIVGVGLLIRERVARYVSLLLERTDDRPAASESVPLLAEPGLGLVHALESVDETARPVAAGQSSGTEGRPRRRARPVAET